MTLEDFKAARSVLAGVIADTHLVHSVAFSKATGNHVYIKPENMQVTGAYKIRGAYYKISTLTPEEKARGLITASAGNHAQGVAYAAQAAGVKATVVMPTTTPLVKVNNTKDYGANVILHGAVSIGKQGALSVHKHTHFPVNHTVDLHIHMPVGRYLSILIEKIDHLRRNTFLIQSLIHTKNIHRLSNLPVKYTAEILLTINDYNESESNLQLKIKWHLPILCCALGI